ncbi:MAG TPA: SDR family NAD(P)-dependent oxidoreductase [Acidobacteriota bacterium]|nr:SDR family NAD(P)-dependent oxidoreductase [Acidobacteriota bacterium]
MSHQGKVAVVTGGGTGIGKAIAVKLGSQGASVAICGRRQEPLELAVQEMQEQGIKAWQSTCDVSKLQDVERFFSQVENELGPVWCLVNNAGSSGVTKVSAPDFDRWDTIIRSNIDSLYYATSHALKSMPDGGRVISLSSILGKFGVPGYTAYCTSKHAVVGFTRAVSLELAPRKITVNALCPGWVETDMAREGMEIGARANKTDYESFRKMALDQVPLGEMIVPDEVAELVAYLASAAARNLTGQSINICGGQVMH